MNIYSYLILSCYRNRDNTFLIENDKIYTYTDLLESMISTNKLLKLYIENHNTTHIEIIEGNAFSFTVIIMLCLSIGKHVKIKNSTYTETLQKNGQLIIDSRTYKITKHCYDESEIQQFMTNTIVGDLSDMAKLSFFSSGTSSGHATEMLSTPENIFFSMMSISSVLKYNNSSRIAVCTPLSFDYSLYQILMSLSSGATVIYYDFRHYAHRVFEKFSQYNANYMALIPAILKHYLVAKKNNPTLDTPSNITLTGETFPQHLYDSCKLLLPETQIITMYGITECKRISIMPPSSCVIDSQCCGIAIPGVSVSVRDFTTNSLSSQGMGECIVHGANVLDGYHDSGPCQFMQTKEGKMLFTGDRITITPQGYIYFEGRESEMLKINGIRVDTRPLLEEIVKKFSLNLKLRSKDNIIQVLINQCIVVDPALTDFIKNYIYTCHGVLIRRVEFMRVDVLPQNLNLKESI